MTDGDDSYIMSDEDDSEEFEDKISEAYEKHQSARAGSSRPASSGRPESHHSRPESHRGNRPESHRGRGPGEFQRPESHRGRPDSGKGRQAIGGGSSALSASSTAEIRSVSSVTAALRNAADRVAMELGPRASSGSSSAVSSNAGGSVSSSFAAGVQLPPTSEILSLNSGPDSSSSSAGAAGGGGGFLNEYDKVAQRSVSASWLKAEQGGPLAAVEEHDRDEPGRSSPRGESKPVPFELEKFVPGAEPNANGANKSSRSSSNVYASEKFEDDEEQIEEEVEILGAEALFGIGKKGGENETKNEAAEVEEDNAEIVGDEAEPKTKSPEQAPLFPPAAVDQPASPPAVSASVVIEERNEDIGVHPPVVGAANSAETTNENDQQNVVGTGPFDSAAATTEQVVPRRPVSTAGAGEEESQVGKTNKAVPASGGGADDTGAKDLIRELLNGSSRSSQSSSSASGIVSANDSHQSSRRGSREKRSSTEHEVVGTRVAAAASGGSSSEGVSGGPPDVSLLAAGAPCPREKIEEEHHLQHQDVGAEGPAPSDGNRAEDPQPVHPASSTPSGASSRRSSNAKPAAVQSTGTDKLSSGADDDIPMRRAVVNANEGNDEAANVCSRSPTNPWQTSTPKFSGRSSKEIGESASSSGALARDSKPSSRPVKAIPIDGIRPELQGLFTSADKHQNAFFSSARGTAPATASATTPRLNSGRGAASGSGTLISSARAAAGDRDLHRSSADHRPDLAHAQSHTTLFFQKNSSVAAGVQPASSSSARRIRPPTTSATTTAGPPLQHEPAPSLHAASTHKSTATSSAFGKSAFSSTGKSSLFRMSNFSSTRTLRSSPFLFDEKEGDYNYYTSDGADSSHPHHTGTSKSKLSMRSELGMTGGTFTLSRTTSNSSVANNTVAQAPRPTFAGSALLSTTRPKTATGGMAAFETVKQRAERMAESLGAHGGSKTGSSRPGSARPKSARQHLIEQRKERERKEEEEQQRVNRNVRELEYATLVKLSEMNEWLRELKLPLSYRVLVNQHRKGNRLQIFVYDLKTGEQKEEISFAILEKRHRALKSKYEEQRDPWKKPDPNSPAEKLKVRKARKRRFSGGGDKGKKENPCWLSSEVEHARKIEIHEAYSVVRKLEFKIKDQLVTLEALHQQFHGKKKKRPQSAMADLFR